VATSARRHIAAAALALLMLGLSWLAVPSQARPSADTGVRDASGDTGNAQTEQTMAVDPTNPQNVLIGYISGISVSHDGGRTWKLSSLSCSGDNNPTFDHSGVAYFECDNNGVEVYYSIDAGDQWAGPNNAVTDVDNSGDFVDRPWIAPGSAGKQIVLGWESFFTNPLGWVFIKTSDGHMEWSPARRVDDSNNPAEQDPREQVTVGADGTIYVVYASGHNPFPAGQTLPTSFVVARSHNGGVTFQRTVAAANITRSSAPTEEAEAISSIAADPNPHRAGHVALAWADQRTRESRILVVVSVNGGATWSKPVDVTGDPAALGNQHDHPQIAFAPDGRLMIVWRDRRCCGGSWQSSYQLFARALTMAPKGALRGGKVIQVTDKPQAPNSVSNLDEYLGLSVGPEGLSVAWNQPRAGVASTYFRRIPLAAFA
jgi:hypothetical protein